MTGTELALASQQTLRILGFYFDSDDAQLYALARQTTPRRFTKAVDRVAGDENCTNALDRYNALLKLLQSPAILSRHQQVSGRPT
jgi:hypothetical protein